MRTDNEKLSKIIELDAAVDSEAFILTANTLVNEVVDGSGYSDTLMELIERWLAAHFYSIQVQAPASERAGDVGITYQHRVDLYFSQTKYGQQALLLDTKGNLARLQERIKKGKKTTGKIEFLGYRSDRVERALR